MNLKQTACLLLFAFHISAQPQAWNNVKTVAPGTEIRVAGPKPSPVVGTLASATDDSVVVTSRTGQETYARQQITRVSIKKSGHRARNTLIGLGVGAGAGLAVGVGTDQSCSPHCFLGNNLGKVIFTPLGAAVGALVGFVIPTGGWKEIYMP